MGADHHHRDRSPAMAGLCGLAAGPRGCHRPEAGFSQRRPQRHHARRALFPGGKRLHADLRPDAQRQFGAWLALSVRRLCRLRHQRVRPAPGSSVSSSHSSSSALVGVAAADPRLPPHGGPGSAADHGHDRTVDRVRRPDAVGIRRRLLPDPDAELADRADPIAARHRGRSPPASRSTCNIRWCGS